MKKLSIFFALLIFSSLFLLTACGKRVEQSRIISPEDQSEELGSSTLINDPMLTKYKWLWEETIYADNTQVKPQVSDSFILVLNDDGTVTADTDCNNMFGNFTVAQGAKIDFPATASTIMYCEGSQETEFAKILDKADNYFFEEDTLMITWEDNEAVSSFTPLFR